MSKEIELGITVSEVYLTVSGTYYPEEPEERYDNNMSGTPISYAEFELTSVKIEDVEIIDIISDSIFDSIVEMVIENQKD